MRLHTPLAGALVLCAASAGSQAQTAALPPAFTATPCNTHLEASQNCNQSGPAYAINTFADLGGLTAGANIDAHLASSASTFANVYYFVQLASSSGSFSAGTVPIIVGAAGITSVGDGGVAGGTAFNHNYAGATVRAFRESFFACSGWQCHPSIPAAFSSVVLVDVSPGTGDSGVDASIWRIEVSARADTNSNYTTSFAHAWADPVISIEPGYAAAHPEVSLIFSANLPVPEPAPAALLLAGLAVVGLLAQRRRPTAATAQRCSA